VGYPECGKTTAIAEYFPQGRSVFWFAVGGEASGSNWKILFLIALARRLDASGYSLYDVLQSLASYEEPLDIVLDDAHRYDELHSIKPLAECVRRKPNLRLLLIGLDDPTFLEAVRGSSIRDWRLPGLSQSEALHLVELRIGSLSTVQNNAVLQLRLQVDGHVGLIRATTDVIQEIRTETDAESMRRRYTGCTNFTVMKSRIIERIRGSLSGEELELAERLAICLVTFTKEIATGIAPPGTQFNDAWTGCVATLFENRRPQRFHIPEIYRENLADRLHSELLPALHRSAASAYGAIVDGAIELTDIYASVVHYLLAGDEETAVSHATTWIATAPDHSSARYLFELLKPWLWNVVGRTPPSLRAGWFAMAMMALDADEDGRLVEAVACRLEIALESMDLDETVQVLDDNSLDFELFGDGIEETPLNTESDSEPEAPGLKTSPQGYDEFNQATYTLGWARLLSHAAAVGNVELARTAALNLRGSDFGADTNEIGAVGAFWAFITAEESPLEYLEILLERRRLGALPPLWSERSNFELFSVLLPLCQTQSSDATETVTRLSQLAKRALEADEPELATMLQCQTVHLQIDALRNFEAARRQADESLELLRPDSDRTLVAHTLDTAGDAERCHNRNKQAIALYRKALPFWQSKDQLARSETLSMMGVCYARLRDQERAIEAWSEASRIHFARFNDNRLTGSLRNAVTCHLEIAASLIRSGDLPTAAKWLLGIHGYLRPQSKDCLEWVALGQLAWSAVSSVSPDPISPPTPGAGFTIAMHNHGIDGAQNTEPTAPTLMLARLCGLLGRPFRAMSLFDDVIAEAETGNLAPQAATLAIESAIDAKNLEAATRYALLGAKISQEPFGDAVDVSRMFPEFLLPQVAQLAFSKVDSPSLIADAIAECKLGNNDFAALLTRVLTAYASVDQPNSDAIETAYSSCIEVGANQTARDLAWYWCYRFAVGKQVYEKDYIKWHWRVCWLTVSFGRGAYLEETARQERSFWQSLPSKAITVRTAKIVGEVASQLSGEQQLLGLARKCAQVTVNNFDVSEASRELVSELRGSSSSEHLKLALNDLSIKFLDLILHPGLLIDTAIPERLFRDIESVSEAARRHRNLGEYLGRFRGLLDLLRVFTEKKPNRNAINVLLQGRGAVEALCPDSAARLFILLRESIAQVPKSQQFEIYKVLAGQQVTSLIHGGALTDHVRIRLQITHLSGRWLIASADAFRAFARLNMQDEVDGPISYAALAKSKTDVEFGQTEIERITTELRQLEEECRRKKLLPEVWKCCMQLGAIAHSHATSSKLTGAPIVEGVLEAIACFERALDAAVESQDEDSILRAAFSLRPLAKYLGNAALESRMSKTISGIAKSGDFDELIRSMEESEAADLLVTEDRGRSQLLDTEEGIQETAEQIMNAMGWPPDRHINVLADVRKLKIWLNEQEVFCRHLLALQNLKHMDSPQTVFARPTMYTCGCELLGHTTEVEVEDVALSISTFKGVYCVECDKKSPIKKAE
jgi:tetratricopeptide (TPR) repeat protein